MTDEFFCALFNGIIDPKYELAVLEQRLSWAQIKQVVAPYVAYKACSEQLW